MRQITDTVTVLLPLSAVNIMLLLVDWAMAKVVVEQLGRRRCFDSLHSSALMTTTTFVTLCHNAPSFGHSLCSQSCRANDVQGIHLHIKLLTCLSLTLPECKCAWLECMDAFTNLCNVLQGRCAAVLMFHTQLALLPAMETEGLELDLMMDDPYGEGVEGPGRASTELVSATVGNSYVVNLAKMGIKKVQKGGCAHLGIHISHCSVCFCISGRQIS